MKKLVTAVAAIAAFGFVNSASAADMPVKMPVKAPIAIPYSWTGWYVGISGGGDWGRLDGSFPVSATAYTHNTSGWVAGGHIGYQYQWSQFVLGVEAGASALGSKGSVTCPTVTFTCSEQADLLLEVTGKFGWAWDRTLLYGKAGWGEERVKSTTSPVFPGYDDAHELGGLILGGGVEYAFWHNWSAGVEYIHLNMGSQTYAPTPFIAGVTRTISGNDNIVRAVLNYKFGG